MKNICYAIVCVSVALGCSLNQPSKPKQLAPMPLAADPRPEASVVEEETAPDGKEELLVVDVLSAEAQEGKKIFLANGCQACHFQETGVTLKPYPSKPRQASISPADFESCVIKGRPGTAMVAYGDRITKGDVTKMWEYILTYKGK